MMQPHNNTQAACPFCGQSQSYEEARPSKPILAEPRLEYQRGGRVKKIRDTYYHTHCHNCGERMIWSCSMYPVSGEVSWRKP